MPPWKSFGQLVVAVIYTLVQQVNAQAPSVGIGFVLDLPPSSLEASIVAVNSVESDIRSRDVVMTIAVDCPKPASPDNDACRAQSIYPAELWHTQGSMFGGIATLRADDSTTAWTCELGTGASRAKDGSWITRGPSCVKSITAAGGATRVETTLLNDCDVQARSVPLLVTAGADKLDDSWYMTYGASKLRSAYDSALVEMGCPARPTTRDSAITTSTSNSGVISTTSTPDAGATPITRVTTSQPPVLEKSTASPSTSSTTTSGSSRACRDLRWAFAVWPVTMCLAVLLT